eukprot:12883078-Prorocentrum_lima.AAC.1
MDRGGVDGCLEVCRADRFPDILILPALSEPTPVIQPLTLCTNPRGCGCFFLFTYTLRSLPPLSGLSAL